MTSPEEILAIIHLNVKKLPAKEGGHWIWTGPDLANYGGLRLDGKTYYAHRAMYAASRGLHPSQIPEGQEVRHRCRTPKCCRNAHLIIGVPKDNSDDKRVDGMHRRAYTLARQPEVIAAIVKDRLAGATQIELGKKYGFNHRTIGRWMDKRGVFVKVEPKKRKRTRRPVTVTAK